MKYASIDHILIDIRFILLNNQRTMLQPILGRDQVKQTTDQEENSFRNFCQMMPDWVLITNCIKVPII